MFRYENLNNLIPPAGEFFWQFSTNPNADPNQIDVKAANGITGINAVLPSNPLFRLMLSDAIAGFPNGFAGGAYVDYATNEGLSAGVTSRESFIGYTDGVSLTRLVRVASADVSIEALDGGITGYVFRADETTGKTEAVNDGAGNTTQEVFAGGVVITEAIDVSGNDNVEIFSGAGRTYVLTDITATKIYSKDVLVDSVIESIDNGAGDVATFQKRVDLNQIILQTGANIVALYTFNKTGLSISHFTGNKFAVEAATGKISAISVAGAHVTPTGEEIEIFDPTTGASKGFLRLFN